MPPIRHEHTEQARARRLAADVVWKIRADKTVWLYHKQSMSRRSPHMNAPSPSSSPRLPSPPPLPELQLGPRSPSIQAIGGEIHLDASASHDSDAYRRVRPGSKAADMARGPPLVPLHQLDTPFQLQEYLQAAYAKMTRDEASETIKPMTKEMARELATPPVQEDTGVVVGTWLWVYELCRFLVQRTNRLIVAFFNDDPPCSSQTCHEMRASEWQYLCAVHNPPKSCCAIDYCCHTLDWAADVLTSPENFPSRLTISAAGEKELKNIFRRVYRIYAHAWYQHKSVFWSIEQEEGLYKFFKAVCETHNLMGGAENYTVPPEAEGEQDDSDTSPIDVSPRSPDFSRRDTQILPAEENASAINEPQTPAQPSQTTRKHRHTPSTGTQIESISEGSEEEEQDAALNRHSRILSHPVPKSASPARSPRPDLHMSLASAQNQLPQTVDATPRPEDHGHDPFDDSRSSDSVEDSLASSVTSLDSDTSATTQIHAQDSTSHSTSHSQSAQPTTPFPDSTTTSFALPVSQSEPPTPISAINSSQFPPHLNPSTPTQSRSVESFANVPSGYIPGTSPADGSIVHSPGGGSIRTIDHDILSGLIGHLEMHSQSSGESSDTTSEAQQTPEALQDPQTEAVLQSIENVEKPIESGTVSLEPASHDKDAVLESAEVEEDPEDFGEIKLAPVIETKGQGQDQDPNQSHGQHNETQSHEGGTEEGTKAPTGDTKDHRGPETRQTQEEKEERSVPTKKASMIV